MIPANELRIGNWVKLIGTDRVYTITFPLHNDLAEQWHTALDYIQPIPLTPEILEKCGFELYDDENNRWSLPSVGQYHFDEGAFYFSTTSRDIKYLHELQNLIYALTKKELQVKL